MSYSITTAEPRKLHSENSECLGSNVSLGSKTESQKFWHNSSHETKQNQGLEVESTTILKEGANTSSNLHPSRLNSVIARAKDGSKFKLEWYHKNYLDHVYAVSDDTGDILEHYRYTAFGEVTIYNENGNQVATTQIDNHILWNTRRRDELTGYYMYKFRHYSAELGRWPSRDPIEERGGVNLYAFVRNDPANSWDRLGNIPIQEDDYPDINDFDVVDFTEAIPFAGMIIYRAAFLFKTDKSNGNPCCIKAYMVILEADVYIKSSLASLEKLGIAGVIGHELKNMRAMNNRIKELVAEIRARKDVCYSAEGEAEEAAKELTKTYNLKSIKHKNDQARYIDSEKYGGPKKGQPIINPNL